MKTTGQCPKCESTDILADVKVIDRGDGDRQWDASIATFQNPNAILFKGKRTSTVSAWVCIECGYMELYADSPEQLQIPVDDDQ